MTTSTSRKGFHFTSFSHNLKRCDPPEAPAAAAAATAAAAETTALLSKHTDRLAEYPKWSKSLAHQLDSKPRQLGSDNACDNRTPVNACRSDDEEADGGDDDDYVHEEEEEYGDKD